MRDIIDGCTRQEKRGRYSVSQLIDHEFFAEGEVKVEVKDEDLIKNTIVFRVEVPNRETKKNLQELFEFSYSLATDVPENVVDEMVRTTLQ